MEYDELMKLSYKDVKKCTNNFSENNLIGEFQFGRVFHGQMGAQQVVVKKWEDPIIYTFYEGNNVRRLQDEIFLFEKHPEVSSHPNSGKLIGYCDASEKQQASVYDIQAVDIVENLVLKDNFTWLQRIKVIFGFARVLEHLHAQTPLPCLLRNISAAHVLVDKDFNAKLFDFSMVTGGVFSDRRCVPVRRYLHGCYTYINFDPGAAGGWSEKVDVLAFGIVVLMLIAKKIVSDEEQMEEDCVFVNAWATNVYNQCKSSKSELTLVHESLQQEEGFRVSDGARIERLAMRCIDRRSTRISMKSFLKQLLKLHAVRSILDKKELTSLKRYLLATSRVA